MVSYVNVRNHPDLLFWDTVASTAGVPKSIESIERLRQEVDINARRPQDVPLPLNIPGMKNYQP